MTDKLTKVQNTTPLSYKTAMYMGFTWMGTWFIWGIFNQFVPIFLQAGNPNFVGGDGVRGFALSPSIALFIMTWDNILNVFWQPWIGARSDRTKSRFGRRKPWIMLGVPIALVGFVLIPFAPSLFAIILFISVTNIGMALFRTPSLAWMGDLFPSSQRSQANGILSLLSGLATVVALIGGGLLFDSLYSVNPTLGRAAPFIVIAILTVIFVTLSIIGVQEPEIIEVDDEAEAEQIGVFDALRNLIQQGDNRPIYLMIAIFLWDFAFYSMETTLSSFGVFSLGLTPGRASIATSAFGVSLIIFSIPAGFMGGRFGRFNTVNIGAIGSFILIFAGLFLVQSFTTMVIMLLVIGLFWTMLSVNYSPIMFDFLEPTQAGLAAGLFLFASQLSAVAGPVLTGIIIDIFGDNYRIIWITSAAVTLAGWVIFQRLRNTVA